MKKLILFFFVFIAAATFSIAQTGSVRGFVYDKNTGETIIFSNVLILNTTHGSSTDNNGYFVISKVPKGEYNVRVTFMGYEEKVFPIKVVAGEITTLKIELEPNSKLLNAVEIRADRLAAKTESQVSIEKITAKEITQMPSIGGTSDLAQYMQVLPGVIFTGDQGGQLYIRGGSAIQNKVLLDGMVIYNPFHSIGLFSVFETDVIRNADIFTGGFGAKYGGVLSSVMDISTRDGNKKQTKGKIGASTFGANVLVEGPIIKQGTSSGISLTYLFTAKNSYLSQTSKKVYSYIDGSLPYDFLDIYGKLTLSGDNGTKISVFGFNYTDKVTDYKSIANFDWANRGVGANFLLLPGNTSALVEGVFSYSDYTVNMKETTTGKAKTSNIGGFNLGLSATNFYVDNKLIYGIEMIGSTTNSNITEIRNGNPTTIPNTNYSTELGVYGLFKGVAGKFLYEPSFRLSYYASMSKASPEPRLALKYNVTDWFRLKAATGLYSQIFIDTKPDVDIVNLFTGYETISPESMNIVRTYKGQEISSYLQTSKHLIVGAEFDITRTITLNLEGYYKTMDGLISLNRNKYYNDDAEYSDKPDFMKKEYAIENGKAYGMDLSLKYDDDRLYVWTVYSLGKVVREDELVQYAPHYDRRHNVNVLISYQVGLSRSWEVSLRWNYGSGFAYTPNKGGQEMLDFQTGIDYDYIYANGTLQMLLGEYNSKRLPEYHRLDLSIKKRFDIFKSSILELNLSVTNVYNRNNLFYQDRITGDRVDQLPVMPSFGLSISF
ncbi:MAG: TonB-dependent receptor [Bacteroidales bacterium]|nr:TonB-dependent receptor [Bacteroidales bacterium]MDD4684456.1 TonB-dependent receptor [Bacteroidales bacterium]